MQRMVSVADIRKDLRDWPGDVIEQWLHYFARWLAAARALGESPVEPTIKRSAAVVVEERHLEKGKGGVRTCKRLVAVASESLRNKGLHAVVGSSWTTDAPFRETAPAIEFAHSQGILAVEMEAAALYSFARTAGVAVICNAHVTNTMGLAEQDFEKGEADGTADALGMLEAIVSGVVFGDKCGAPFELAAGPSPPD
jgi:hypothetical protein